MFKNFFTTGEVADFIGVSKKTVKNYCAKGIIKSTANPLTGYRRIYRNDFNDFLKNSGIPYNPFESSGPQKFLIADDDAFVREIVQRMLRDINRDFLLRTSENGYQTCLEAGVFLPDILFLDLNMPQMNGFEVITVLKESPHACRIRIVIVTAYASDETRAQLARLGIHEVLEKPFTFKELSAFV